MPVTALCASTVYERVGSTLHSSSTESTVTDSDVTRMSGDSIFSPVEVSSVMGTVTRLFSTAASMLSNGSSTTARRTCSTSDAGPLTETIDGSLVA